MTSYTLLFFVIVKQYGSGHVIVNPVYETISPNAPSRLGTSRFDSDGIQSSSCNFRTAGLFQRLLFGRLLFQRLLLSEAALLSSWLLPPVLQIQPRPALLSRTPAV